MTASCFADSNLLVYVWDQAEPEKQARARAWMEALWRRSRGRLSVQVLHELYVNATRKLDPPVDAREARAEIRNLLAWRPVELDAGLQQRAWEIEDRLGFHFWDALIVAAAQRAGCRYLISEDLQDGQDIDGVRVVDPFAHEPDELLGPDVE